LTRDELQLGNLDTRRDFTYISDSVDGFIRAAEAEGVEGQAFNLGTGREATIREIVELVFKITGRTVPVRQDVERMRPERSEVMRLLADNNKARERLGWSPAVGLEEGLTKTIDWMKEHLSLYDPDHYQR
jgi:dTDP-glucose 4,6-dehydratase